MENRDGQNITHLWKYKRDEQENGRITEWVGGRMDGWMDESIIRTVL